MKQALFQLHYAIRQKLKVNFNNDNMYFICCSTNVDTFCITLQPCLLQIVTSSLIHCSLFIHLFIITTVTVTIVTLKTPVWKPMKGIVVCFCTCFLCRHVHGPSFNAHGKTKFEQRLPLLTQFFDNLFFRIFEFGKISKTTIL